MRNQHIDLSLYYKRVKLFFNKVFVAKSSSSPFGCGSATLWGFFVFSLVYQSLFYRYGLNLWDEGVIYSGAARLLDGQSINTDFFGYQPGRYYLLALFFKLLGPSIETGRIMWVPLTSLMVTLTLVVSRKMIEGKWAWFPPLFLLAAPSMVYSRFFPLFTVINLYFLCRLAENFHRKNLAFSLLSAAGTFFFSKKRSASLLFS